MFSSPYTYNGDEREDTSKRQSANSQSLYKEKKDKVKKVFLSKDELFAKVNHKFRNMLKTKTKHIQEIKQLAMDQTQMWSDKERMLMDTIKNI